MDGRSLIEPISTRSAQSSPPSSWDGSPTVLGQSPRGDGACMATLLESEQCEQVASDR